MSNEHRFVCSDCGEEKVHVDSMTTGYGVDSAGNKVCFDCCGKRDRAAMIETGRAVLYLTVAGLSAAAPLWPVVTNWPGTLKIQVESRSKGRHNLAGCRTDVWFNGPDGCKWHGVTYGDNTQICHCRRLKSKAKRAA